MSQQNYSVEGLKSDLMDKLQDHDEAELHVYGAINWARMLQNISGALDKIGPEISSFTPAQYSVLINTLVAVIHAVNGNVNPS